MGSSMTRYHFLPGRRACVNTDLTSEDQSAEEISKGFINYKKSVMEKSKHAQLAARGDLDAPGEEHKGGKHNKHNKKDQFKEYFLEEPNELAGVLMKMNEGDTLVIHGEGEPFVIGFAEPTIYDLYPHRLLKILMDNTLPMDRTIHIDLLCCHSAATFKNTNFARDVAILLGCYGYRNIDVSGYTGLVKEQVKQKNIKFSCVGDPHPEEHKPENTTNITRAESLSSPHSNLENARVTYNSSGKVLKEGSRGSNNPLTKFGDEKFPWAGHYISEYERGLSQALEDANKKIASSGKSPPPTTPLPLKFFDEKTEAKSPINRALEEDMKKSGSTPTPFEGDGN